MVTLLLRLLRLLPLFCCAHRHLALENLALRHQLAVYKKTVARPKVCRSDRLFWVALSRVWAGWRQALVIVSPNTVLRWQRRRFREYWARLSARPAAGRQRVSRQIRAPVVRMAQANPLWGAPRIHGELQKLGIDVAERTVSLLLPKRPSPPSQTWRTFLTNHVRDLVSIDFFTVPTARLRVLFVFVVLAHDRRRVLHFNVTEHPTAVWTAQQIVDAFPDDSAPSYCLRDRDSVYARVFRQRVKGMGAGEVLTAPHSPWQNSFAERLTGSIRRECLNHVLVLGERHLRRTLTRYFAYYHRARTHLSLDKDEIGLDATNTAVEVVADQSATRCARAWRPPADAEDVMIQVAEDLVAEFAPDRYVYLKCSGEAALSGFSCRVFSAQALDISTCHRPLQPPQDTGRGKPGAAQISWWPHQRDSNPRLGLERASPWLVISRTSTPGATARCHSRPRSAPRMPSLMI